MGTIRRKEARQVIADLMDKNKIPRAVWSITPSGELNFMIGSRVVTLQASGGMSYYAMKGLEERVEAAIRDYINRPDRRQIDLEELVEARA